jgi:hypothetical protein
VPAKTIYVRPDDEALIEREEQWAARHRLGLSALIAAALEEYLAARGISRRSKASRISSSLRRRGLGQVTVMEPVGVAVSEDVGVVDQPVDHGRGDVVARHSAHRPTAWWRRRSARRFCIGRRRAGRTRFAAEASTVAADIVEDQQRASRPLRGRVGRPASVGPYPAFESSVPIKLLTRSASQCSKRCLWRSWPDLAALITR